MVETSFSVASGKLARVECDITVTHASPPQYFEAMDNTSSLKRKRVGNEDEDDQDQDADWYDDNDGFLDDESEPHRFGQPVLPVANLPNSFEGVPQDGMEYLFTVRYAALLRELFSQHYLWDSKGFFAFYHRREERRLPIVTRVVNPYAVPEVAHHDPGVHANVETFTGAIPSEEWRACFEERFRNLRAVCIVVLCLGP